MEEMCAIHDCNLMSKRERVQHCVQESLFLSVSTTFASPKINRKGQGDSVAGEQMKWSSSKDLLILDLIFLGLGKSST